VWPQTTHSLTRHCSGNVAQVKCPPVRWACHIDITCVPLMWLIQVRFEWETSSC